MLEEGLKRNIIVAASVFLSFTLCPGKKGGSEAERFCLQTRNLRWIRLVGKHMRKFYILFLLNLVLCVCLQFYGRFQ